MGAEGPSFHRRFAREKIEVLLECWGESIKEIYLIASWNAQFSIHFLDGRGWMVVQITLLHLQEVICLSETAKIILLEHIGFVEDTQKNHEVKKKKASKGKVW